MYGLTRYDEFQRSLRIARKTLSDRLGKLVDAGVMTKRFYQDNPPRYEYLLTEMAGTFSRSWRRCCPGGINGWTAGAARRSRCVITGMVTASSAG